MPCAPLLRFNDQPEDKKAEAGEVMSGVLEVIRGSPSPLTYSPTLNRAGCSKSLASTASQRVFVRVYRTSSEHFAVLYPVRAIVTACRPLASLNLRSCTVKPLGSCPSREFRVSPRACEGMSVTFKAIDGTSETQMSDWLRAFSEIKETSQRRKVSDHRLPLPVLVESEEDEAAE